LQRYAKNAIIFAKSAQQTHNMIAWVATLYPFLFLLAHHPAYAASIRTKTVPHNVLNATLSAETAQLMEVVAAKICALLHSHM